jgi:hypothetical protein
MINKYSGENLMHECFNALMRELVNELLRECVNEGENGKW